jgi:hypothetical protein
MSETTETAPGAAETDTTTTTEVTAETADETSPNKEAAKYRTRLRETETERDRLAGIVSTMQTREVERLAGDVLANGADLLELGGIDLADLLDDDGRPDAEKVEAAARTILETRPYLAASRGPRPDPSQGAKPAAPEKPTTLGWGEVLRGTGG